MTPRPVPCSTCSHRWAKHSAGIGRCGESGCACVAYKGNAADDLVNAMQYHQARSDAAARRLLEDVLRDIDRMAATGNRWAQDMARSLRGAGAAVGGNVEALAALGLQPGATVDHVKAAFRARALEAHPDHGGTDERMRELLRIRDEAIASLGVV